jgi:hypothetical protein
MGAEKGPSSYTERTATRCDRKGSFCPLLVAMAIVEIWVMAV